MSSLLLFRISLKTAIPPVPSKALVEGYSCKVVSASSYLPARGLSRTQSNTLGGSFFGKIVNGFMP